ncbi:MAG: DUF1579 domain-containing protein, partial [Pseudoxanthomonas sp.]
KTDRKFALAVIAVALALPLSAQEAAPKMTPEQQQMMEVWQKISTPGPQHKQLAEHLAGTWTTKQTVWMDPSAPPMTETGKATVTPIFGGRQLRMDFTGSFMGQPFEGLGYNGYDINAGKYTNSWTDSGSTAVMNSTGDYDAASKTYTFTGQMPDMKTVGGVATGRNTLRVVDADHLLMEMFENKGGKEVRTMQMEYTRVK